jgi:large subunit ribosomal protein L15
MASGGRAKRFRGNHTHGRGKKAGRGAGLKGGRGRAGANKHRFLQLQILGGKHEHLAAKRWGRIGFKYRSRDGNPKPESLNVGDLALEFPGKSDIDLTAAGYGKLLGSGSVSGKLTVKVASASAGAVEKVKAAGGQVLLPPKPAEPAKDAKAGGAKGDAKPAGKPAQATAGRSDQASAPPAPKPDAAKSDKGKPSGA